MTRRSPAGYPMCTWDDTCPYAGTHGDPNVPGVMCPSHLKAWRAGERPGGQLLLDLEAADA